MSNQSHLIRGRLKDSIERRLLVVFPLAGLAGAAAEIRLDATRSGRSAFAAASAAVEQRAPFRVAVIISRPLKQSVAAVTHSFEAW